MPNIHVDLASALLTSRYGSKFGHLVRVIGGADFIALTQIESRLEAYQGDTEIRIRRGEVEPMMALLIWHKYATFKQSNGKAVYKLGMDEILRISHYPRYMYHICELFDDRGRCMIEDILLHGRLEQGAIVRNQIRREFGDKATHDPSVVSLVLETFKTMVGTTFLVREPNLSDADSDIPSFNACDELEKYQVNSELGEEKVEERKIEYWTINGDRFENYIRDQIMVDDAAEHCGQLASHVLRNTLRISEHGLARLTEPEYAVSYKQIEHACKEAHIVYPVDMPFDLVLQLLVRAEYLTKSPDGQYKIQMRRVIKRCFRQSSLQWIATKYGVEARKILHLLQNEQYYEPATIAKKCLIDDKEAKRVIYRLVTDSILKIQDMPRPGTNHFHAQHSVYLFHGDFTQIAKITRKRLLQTQANLARRLEKEYAQVEEELRLREKIEALKERAKMDETVIEDLELKPRQLSALATFEKAQQRLLQCLRALDMELEITNLYLHYARDELMADYYQSQRK